jgi:hypothetical protein
MALILDLHVSLVAQGLRNAFEPEFRILVDRMFEKQAPI